MAARTRLGDAEGADAQEPGGRQALVLALLLPVVLVTVIGARAIAAGFVRPSVPAAIPAARAGAGLVADPVHHVLVLFGGRGLDGDLDDTWTWDGAAWTQQHPRQSPLAQEDARLVWDGTRHRVLLIGGSLRFGDLPRRLVNELWSWDGTTWQPDSAMSPTPAGDLADDLVAWDHARGNLVLVTSTVTSEYRTIPLPPSEVQSTPTPRPRPQPGTPPPPPQWWSPGPPTGVRVPTDVRTRLRTWTWGGAGWVDHGETSLVGGFDVTAMAADVASGRVELLARQDPPICPAPTGDGPSRVQPQGSVAPRPAPLPPNCPTPPPLADLQCSGTGSDLGTEQLSWDGEAWRPVRLRGLACGFVGAELLPDPSTGRLLARSGDEFLRWDGVVWRDTPSVAAFRGRAGAAIAADPQHHEVVLFGGRRAGVEANDLWTWDGHGWTMRGGTPPPAPVPTDQPAWASPTPRVHLQQRNGGGRRS